MKVIIFGGSGFLGSHVADAFSTAGHSVTIFDVKESPHLKGSQRFIKGDILDYERVRKAVSGQDVVYNFAGISDIDEASKSPVRTVETNIIGNTNLLEASRIYKIKRFVFASTLYVYSNAGSFYRCSKQSCELIIEAYSNDYGLDYTILRYGSLYGLRADASNWIYSILRQALTEGRIIRHGDGQEIREYIHVEDAAKCSIEALDKSYKNKSVIITGNQPMKVCDLLVMIREIMNNKISIKYDSHKNDPLHYEISPYSFNPRMALKIFNNSYVDLGQGLMQVLSHIYEKEVYKNGASINKVVSRRKRAKA
jgi:Nucleoside-diphosphate-sugar epimerases